MATSQELKLAKSEAAKAQPARHLENRLRDPKGLSESMLLATAFELDDMAARAHQNRTTWGSSWWWCIGVPLTNSVNTELCRRAISVPSQLSEAFNGWCDIQNRGMEVIYEMARANGWKG